METDALPLPATTVCVTGASGFIGSWLVMRLLQRGYIVHATARDPENKQKVKHLLELPRADTNLTLWKADMTVEGSFDEAIHGCEGVFHVATPMDFESKDPVVSFSSKKLIGMGFTFKYTLEDMYRGAIETCREKGLLPYSTKNQANREKKELLLNSKKFHGHYQEELPLKYNSTNATK